MEIRYFVRLWNFTPSARLICVVGLERKYMKTLYKLVKASDAALLVWLATSALVIPTVSLGQHETEYLYLSGHGKDDPVQWNFFCTGGRNSGKWTKIPVPSHWELHGFGSYNYGKDLNKSSENGIYRHEFTVPNAWNGRRIKIIFEGVMTDTEVKVNGKLAGPVHQGGFYRFSYDITELIKPGRNRIEVTVSKVSANESVEAAERMADYWVFGGIYRPVYLEALPVEYIDWTSVDADADGGFDLDVHLQHIDRADNVVARVLNPDGEPLGSEMSAAIEKGQEKVRVSTKIAGHDLWTAESPNLYNVQIELRDENKLIHSVTRRFGFRTFEVRPGEGLFLNGSKIRLKGVNRHSFWPDSGRCLSRELSYSDVRLIKEMNMNAVRMSHYPPDVHFLEACDELGLYVLDELAAWQEPSYDTKTAERLVAQMVKRDQMHPCILFWDNANEGGWNTEADDDFAKYDIQQRKVLHPWEFFSGVDTDHYETYASVQNKLNSGNLFLPTEFLHGLYDGGHGAGLDDYWNLMKNSKLGAGGFLWVFSDEGVVRTDKEGAIDVAGNFAPDGIVGPYREKEGSFFTIKEIWSPVQILTENLPENFNGVLDVENSYDFRNLDTCTFNWEIVKFAGIGDRGDDRVVLMHGTIRGPSVAPGKHGKLNLNLPNGWSSGDALYLTAYDSENRDLFTWTWSLQRPSEHLKRATESRKRAKLRVKKDGDTLRVTAGAFTAEIDRRTGLLKGLIRNGKKLSLANGPRVVQLSETNSERASPKIKIHKKKNHVVLDVVNPGNGLDELTWKIHASGFLEMKCSYSCEGEYDFHGVTFDYPEKLIIRKRWLGDGPYRVWKNRMKGTQFGLWQIDYNDSHPGVSWVYPEFKGYFSNLNWLELDTVEGALAVATDQQDLFFRLYAPREGQNPRSTAIPPFSGDLSFLHAIPATGTKFKAAIDLGPESQKTKANGKFEISIYFF